jgi:hypothetical protein
MEEPSHDIKIKVVDNGYVLGIQDRTLVFVDITKLDEWIKENLSTPEIANKTVVASKSVKADDQLIFGGTPYNIPAHGLSPWITTTGTGQITQSWSAPAGLHRGGQSDYNSNSPTEEISDKKGTPEHESMLRRIANNIEGTNNG